ncbi:hypothetical protein BD410DRAFT_795876 [Rickenella mellea]|uniref:Uncharacterized protein n=1 Tax=Rickenella mellea TaxID=50990 RepID=A0A4Y7PKD6_9AGAM|nr:hypothetical protein BD410DRAFT_795876 [Rickenella mellea]
MSIWSRRGLLQAHGARGKADLKTETVAHTRALRNDDHGPATDFKTIPNSRRLPPELLLPIFVRVVQAQFSSAHHSKERLMCIAISRVCQYWRQTALSCPEIWSCIDTSWGRLAMDFACRSQTTPLTIFVRLEGRPRMWAVAAINVVLGEKHRERIREMRVSADDMNCHHANFCNGIRTPQLQALSVHNNSQIIWRMSQLPFTLSGTLKTLAVSNLYLPQDSLMLRNVTRLKVDRNARLGLAVLYVSDIIKMLQMCPNLEELDFSDSNYVNHDVSPHMIGDLLSLRHVRLTMNSNACQALLSRLTLRPTINLFVDGSEHPESSVPLPTYLFSTYDALDVIVMHNGCFKMKAFRIGDVEDEYTAEALCLYQDLGLDGDFTLSHTFFDGMLPQVHSLSINFDTDKAYVIPKSRWTETLIALPCLHSLTIKVGIHHRFWPPAQIIVSLMQALSEKDGYQRLSLCHNLRIVVLEGIYFNGTVGNSALSHLISFAAAREIGEARISTIDVSSCIGVTSRSVQAMECLVDQVVW